MRPCQRIVSLGQGRRTRRLADCVGTLAAWAPGPIPDLDRGSIGTSASSLLEPGAHLVIEGFASPTTATAPVGDYAAYRQEVTDVQP